MDFWVLIFCLLKYYPFKTEFERYLPKDPKVNERRYGKGVEGMDDNSKGKAGPEIRSSPSTASFPICKPVSSGLNNRAGLDF